MKMLNSKKLIILVLIGFAISFLSLHAQYVKNKKGESVGMTVNVKDTQINWEAYDSTSTISADNIEIKDLQGLWKAYKGEYKFKDIVKGMELNKPMIFEVKDNKARRNLNDSPIPFSLRKNFIVMMQNHEVQSGIINKVSPTELTITWKNGTNYTRYFYTKK